MNLNSPRFLYRFYDVKHTSDSRQLSSMKLYERLVFSKHYCNIIFLVCKI